MEDKLAQNGRAGGDGRDGTPRSPIRLVGGQAGRQLEREQAQAVAEMLGWLAANPAAARSAAAMPAPRAGSGMAGPAPAERVPHPGQRGHPARTIVATGFRWPDDLRARQLRKQAH